MSGGLLSLVPLVFAPPAQAASRSVTIPGGTHYVKVVENDIHGDLTLFRAYYPDGYIHGTIVPSGNGPVRDLEHFTCINPEVAGSPPCPVSFPVNDQMLTSDPEALGTLGQPLTGLNRNVLIDFHAVGQGPTLQWRTYEHGPHTEFLFRFADGYELYVHLTQPTHIYDIALVTQPTTATATSHAIQIAADAD